MRKFALAVLSLAAVLAGFAVADDAKDARKRWVYEGGWFAQDADGWYELNEEIYRTQGKPMRFAEAKRTDECIDLYDAKRGVSVRLSEGVMEAKWDADGKDAEWKLMYKGKWKAPAK